MLLYQLYRTHKPLNVINYYPSDDEESAAFFFSFFHPQHALRNKSACVACIRFFFAPSFHPYSFLVLPSFFFYGCSPLYTGYNLLPALYRRFIIRSVSRPPPRRHHRACCFCFLFFTFATVIRVIQRSSIRHILEGLEEEEEEEKSSFII